MRKTMIIRVLSTLVAVVVVATAATVIGLRMGHATTVVEATSIEPGFDPGATPPTPAPEPPATTIVAPDTTIPTPTIPAATIPGIVAVPPAPVPPTAPPPSTGPAVSLRRGDSGTDVADLQLRLRDLGYWLGDADGNYASLTEQAVTAFQKVEGLGRDGVAGPSTRAALAVAERPSSAASGDMIEIDKGLQVVFVIRDGVVAWALNTSTGTEEPYQLGGVTEMADTPEGSWNVSWVVDGDDYGALGALYRPRYFHPDGIAVHGYHSVPAYPASHGCVRVSEAAMDWIWTDDLMPMGSVVWVH